MTKVEEIARAIYGATPHNKPFEQYVLNATKRQALYAQALAALEATREPSENMIDHADRTVSADSDNQQCPEWFSAAIDAAIAEHEGR